MDISFDFETLGLHLHACPLEFGAALFDPKTGKASKKFTCFIDVTDAIVNYDCRVYPSVGKWWAGRGLPEFFERHDSLLVSDFLEAFKKFVPENFDGRFWAKNPIFDVGILERLYLLKARGDVNFELPWKYNKIRDLTQLKEVAVSLGYVPNKEKGVIAHRALRDALDQAKEISEMLKYLESVNSLRF